MCFGHFLSELRENLFEEEFAWEGVGTGEGQRVAVVS